MVGLENKYAFLIPLIPALMAGVILISQGILKTLAGHLATAAVLCSGILGYDIFIRVLSSGNSAYHDESSSPGSAPGACPLSLAC